MPDTRFWEHVFPGAGYIEAALAAVRQLRPESAATEVSELQFHEPLPLPPKSPIRLQLSFAPNGRGGFDFQFSSRESASSGWTRHASGKAANLSASPGTTMLDDVRCRCTELITAKAHYEEMARQGLDYGENFRAIRQIWRTRDEAIAELELDAGTTSEVGDYCVHPVLIDAALQVIAATIEPAAGRAYSNESYVPQGVRNVRFYSSTGGRATCLARLISGSPGDPEVFADLRLVTDSGGVCLEIEGLRLALVGSSQAGARGKLDDWLYQLEWDEVPRLEKTPELRGGSWIVFADAPAFGHQLARELSTAQLRLLSPSRKRSLAGTMRRNVAERRSVLLRAGR